MENSDYNVSAVIFDLDGTLLNTEQLTKNVLKDFLAKYGKVQDGEKEKKRMGRTFKESTDAILADYELPLTPEQFSIEIMPMYKGKWLQAKALPGANRLMGHLHKHGVPFSLASNSMTNNVIGKVLNQDGWKERFKAILGSDQVRSGKPSPDIFLEAANRMGVDPLDCLVIEDSLVGVKAGKAAGMKVVAVPSLQMESDSYSIADTILHSLLEFQPELWGLPPFQDWVDNALPIEPIHLSGVFSNSLLQMHAGSITFRQIGSNVCLPADNGISILPDQIWGLYIGWAKFDGQNVFKAVISIGWGVGCCNSKREIRACIIDGIGRDDSNYDAEMQLLLVGYLRTSFRPGNILNSLVIFEEDKTTADAALSLPQFSHKSCKSFSIGGCC